jgi:hypothetical protein
MGSRRMTFLPSVALLIDRKLTAISTVMPALVAGIHALAPK